MDKAVGANVYDFRLTNSYVVGGSAVSKHQGDSAAGMAFLADVGPGPILLENNYLEAFYSPVFIGGADASPIPERTAIIQSGTLRRTILHSGTARGGTARTGSSPATITLDSGASSVDEAYNGHFVYIDGGKPETVGMHRLITDYDGRTKVASVVSDWDWGPPDATSTFSIVSSTDPQTGTAVLDRVGDMALGDYVAFRLRPYPQVPVRAREWGVGEITEISGTSVKFNALRGSIFEGFDKEPMPGGEAVWRGSMIRDVTLRRNTIMANGPHFRHLIGKRYSKNWMEVKQVDGLLVEGNLFTCGIPTNIALYPINQNGGFPWAEVSNVIFRHNHIHNYSAAFTMAFYANYCVQQDRSHDILIVNNLLEGADPQDCVYGGPYFIGTLHRGRRITIAHNTALNVASAGVAVPPGTAELVIRDNIMRNGSYGWACTEGGTWDPSCYATATMTGNVVIDNRLPQDKAYPFPSYPEGNWHPETDAQVGWVDPFNGNYRLSTSSPYKGMATDGTDPGVDMDKLLTALDGHFEDAIKPSTPTGLQATVISSSHINLSWTPSTDNAGVAGYRIYRNGTQIGTATGTSYEDTGLRPKTTYKYHVVAYDGSGNVSPKSKAMKVTTQPKPSTKFTIGDRVQVTGKVGVRATASSKGTLAGTQVKGSMGTVIGGPWFANGAWWWEINFDNAPDGWVIARRLNSLPLGG